MTGPTWSRIWSMGRMPQMTISSLVETNDGITRPGQSHSCSSSSMLIVCSVPFPMKSVHQEAFFLIQK